MSKRCFQCEQDNPDNQTFCGGCGSVLALKDFVTGKVDEAVKVAVRDRDVLETESAIRVFERAWGWVKILGGIAAICIGIVGFGAFWTFRDLRSSVELAKKAVSDSSSEAKNEISATATKSVREINNTSKSANDASLEATLRARTLSNSAVHTKAELTQEALSVRTEVENSKLELASASKLRPEIESLRTQLGSATSAIEAQQKVLASSEDFAKQIFSSHLSETFYLDQLVKPRSIVVPPPGEKGITVVYLLLPSAPIRGTLQLQYNIFVQLPETYFNIHNLVVFYWGDPADNLKQKPISISYFPDISDKELITSLTIRDGRVYADDQPMPKMNAIDQDFKGNKWTPIINPKQ
jgi:hypothetical protein